MSPFRIGMAACSMGVPSSEVYGEPHWGLTSLCANCGQPWVTHSASPAPSATSTAPSLIVAHTSRRGLVYQNCLSASSGAACASIFNHALIPTASCIDVTNGPATTASGAKPSLQANYASPERPKSTSLSSQVAERAHLPTSFTFYKKKGSQFGESLRSARLSVTIPLTPADLLRLYEMVRNVVDRHISASGLKLSHYSAFERGITPDWVVVRPKRYHRTHTAKFDDDYNFDLAVHWTAGNVFEYASFNQLPPLGDDPYIFIAPRAEGDYVTLDGHHCFASRVLYGFLTPEMMETSQYPAPGHILGLCPEVQSIFHNGSFLLDNTGPTFTPEVAIAKGDADEEDKVSQMLWTTMQESRCSYAQAQAHQQFPGEGGAGPLLSHGDLAEVLPAGSASSGAGNPGNPAPVNLFSYAASLEPSLFIMPYVNIGLPELPASSIAVDASSTQIGQVCRRSDSNMSRSLATQGQPPRAQQRLHSITEQQWDLPPLTPSNPSLPPPILPFTPTAAAASITPAATPAETMTTPSNTSAGRPAGMLSMPAGISILFHRTPTPPPPSPSLAPSTPSGTPPPSTLPLLPQAAPSTAETTEAPVLSTWRPPSTILLASWELPNETKQFNTTYEFDQFSTALDFLTREIQGNGEFEAPGQGLTLIPSDDSQPTSLKRSARVICEYLRTLFSFQHGPPMEGLPLTVSNVEIPFVPIKNLLRNVDAQIQKGIGDGIWRSVVWEATTDILNNLNVWQMDLDGWHILKLSWGELSMYEHAQLKSYGALLTMYFKAVGTFPLLFSPLFLQATLDGASSVHDLDWLQQVSPSTAGRLAKWPTSPDFSFVQALPRFGDEGDGNPSNSDLMRDPDLEWFVTTVGTTASHDISWTNPQDLDVSLGNVSVRAAICYHVFNHMLLGVLFQENTTLDDYAQVEALASGLNLPIPHPVLQPIPANATRARTFLEIFGKKSREVIAHNLAHTPKMPQEDVVLYYICGVGHVKSSAIRNIVPVEQFVTDADDRMLWSRLLIRFMMGSEDMPQGACPLKMYLAIRPPEEENGANGSFICAHTCFKQLDWQLVPELDATLQDKSRFSSWFHTHMYAELYVGDGGFNTI
ncbi:hypothetical protein FISHEDRAFT_62856 [Fistulina hepatica ATCC 64428]|uniref:Uncharacterized protein n=1 Tax=Fistulina hepatica ATCC 64428 TaxID=1128425 RepID=A0A0D6ZZE6_9AGAR|nr:hypothetical protein FISHEDRAFT_62856 [Fistulina hepatica ATCC 64428]